MRFPLYFKRAKGAGITDPLLGSDTTPTVASDRVTFSNGGTGNKGSNVFSHKLQRPLERVAIGWWYEGGGAAPANLPVAIWVWDDTSSHWFKAASGTLTNGVLTYLQCPSLCDPPAIAANMSFPQHGVDVMVVVGDNAGADGVYHFVAGPDSAFF